MSSTTRLRKLRDFTGFREYDKESIMGQHEDCVTRQQQTHGLAVIGDVSVHFGQPLDGNPYKGDGGLYGDERKAALLEFHDTGKCEGYTFWYAPCCGGAHVITREGVNW